MGRDVPRIASPQTSVQFLCENYYACVTEHPDCHYKAKALLPTRVVDVSEPKFRLVEHPPGATGRYAALSYSWGDKGFKMTTSKNYEELKRGFDQDILPPAFVDAAVMAQSLEIRYLWIDTLCIIQDSDVDWTEQAARMGDIFEGATITIAASYSSNPYQSLFGKRGEVYEEIDLCSESQGELADIAFKARRKIDRGIHDKTGRSMNTDPLDTRAWGLQEKKLSPRLIAFTGAELQWTCRSLKTCECHQNPYPSQPLFPTPTGMPEDMVILKYARAWSQTVEDYSARKLTFQEDLLPALGGLAKKFGTVTSFGYIGGVWKESFLYDLSWQRDIEPLMRPKTWLSPSFSWASAPGAVNFRFARHSYPGSRVPHTKLLGSYYRPAGADIYSRAGDGYLLVQGHTVAARLRTTAFKDSKKYAICIEESLYTPNTDQKAACEFSIDAAEPRNTAKGTSIATQKTLYDSAFEEPCQNIDEPITLLSLYSIHHQRYLYQNFLILARSHQTVNTYRRIGVGSGKLYRTSGGGDVIPSEPQNVRPFEWLAVDLGKSGRSIGTTAEQVICIR